MKILVMLCVLCGLSCSSDTDGSVKLESNFGCMERTDDPTGYLQPICLYLVANYDVYNVDPNTLSIEAVVSGEEWQGSASAFATSDYDFVELSCCYTGDLAVVEKAHREVVDFILGDR